MYNKPIDLNKVKDFIDSCGPNTKVYLGCDSERMRVNGIWHADYIIAIVIHIDGKHGCKIFGEVTRERDYEKIKNKPTTILILGKKEMLDIKTLEKYGTVKYLTLKDVFGY